MKKTKKKSNTKRAPAAPKRTPAAGRDPRLPAPGTVLQRPWHRKVYEITVGESDFACGGKTFGSLSALARDVTGAKSINGFLWAGLIKRPATAKPATPKTKKAKAAKTVAETTTEAAPKEGSQ